MIPYTTQCYYEESIEYIRDMAINNTSYIKKCEQLVEEKYKFPHTIFTTSCTHSLEMMAMILGLGEGDEVLIPSYTFVSTANAFVKFGATIKCVDSQGDNPNIDPDQIEKLINKNTKALVVVHYGGWACDMEKIREICKKNNIYLLEDAAQAINSYYNNKPLGTFGIMSAFSFHSTKNIGCGEGGMLVINDISLINKARIIYDKGTNRYDFKQGKIDKYEWIGVGSSYSMGEINAAYLYPQLKKIQEITEKRKKIWEYYYDTLKEYSDIAQVSEEVDNCVGNYHIFYLLFKNRTDMLELKSLLKFENITASEHYKPLHKSKFYVENFSNVILKNAERFGSNLLRLPIYNSLSESDCIRICVIIKNYFNYFNLYITKIRDCDLSPHLNEQIIQLKNQYWKYSVESQKKWMEDNIKQTDNHILLTKNKKIIGYLLISGRNVNIIDSFIIDEEHRGLGYGGMMMKYVSKHNEGDFLLCKTKNIKFYEKYGWKKTKDVEIVGKKINKNLHKMITINKSIKKVDYTI